MSSDSKPRVGIPYRTLVEQIENKRDRYERYLLAVRNAGGEIEEIPLDLSPTELEQRAVILDAIVLPDNQEAAGGVGGSWTKRRTNAIATRTPTKLARIGAP